MPKNLDINVHVPASGAIQFLQEKHQLSEYQAVKRWQSMRHDIQTFMAETGVWEEIRNHADNIDA